MSDSGTETGFDDMKKAVAFHVLKHCVVECALLNTTHVRYVVVRMRILKQATFVYDRRLCIRLFAT